MKELDQESTGHAQVDDVLASIAALDRLPVADHVAVYEAATGTLREALTGVPAPTAPPG